MLIVVSCVVVCSVEDSLSYLSIFCQLYPMWLNYLLQGQEEICVDISVLLDQRSTLPACDFPFCSITDLVLKLPLTEAAKTYGVFVFFQERRKIRWLFLAFLDAEVKTYMYFKSLIKHGTTKHLIFLSNLIVWGYKLFLIYIKIQFHSLNCYSLQ